MKIDYRCKDGRSFRLWTKPEIHTLRLEYPRRSNVELGELLVRPWKSIISMAHRLRLKKSPAYRRVTNANNRRRKE